MLTASIEPYATIGLTIVFVLIIIIAILILAHTVGPKRHGPVKDSPYESGMPVIGNTQRRISVPFYIVAVLFLLFDVELIFLWPWTRVFHHAAKTGAMIPLEQGGEVGAGFMLVSMGIFFSLLVFGLIYEWKKGAFRWE